MKVLGIETSCDETAIAVVEDGRRLLSNVVASQVDIHTRYGGIVPEVASRQHILQMVPIFREALRQANVEMEELSAIAVTHGPGLAGSLLVGVNFAKALAFSLELPLVGANHLEGHVYASWLMSVEPEKEPGFPLLCLIASGGHTDLILMERHGAYRLLGRTRDDAAGEAFDKAARILGLGYPGGPAVQRVSRGAQGTEKLPRAWLHDSLDFSFSGLKTALLHKAQDAGIYPPPATIGGGAAPSQAVVEMAAAFQESVVDVMVTKTLRAAREHKVHGIVVGGGVAANALLRETMVRRSPLPVLIPRPDLCTDNGAMVAACGYFRLTEGDRSTWDLDVVPSLRLG